LVSLSVSLQQPNQGEKLLYIRIPQGRHPYMVFYRCLGQGQCTSWDLVQFNILIHRITTNVYFASHTVLAY